MGRPLSIRGRRQAGKSRLTQTARRSTLPGAHLFDGITLDNRHAALRRVASALPEGPAIAVLDEFPWLVQSSPSLEGALQTVWDQVFESKSVLLILIGSDLAMMEELASYNRPLFGRAKEFVVEPFTVADTAVTTTNNFVTKMSGVQRRQGLRLEEIQQALDLQNGRLDRIEDTQRQILDLLRGRQDDAAEQ